MNQYEQKKFDLETEQLFKLINENANKKKQEAYQTSQNNRQIKASQKMQEAYQMSQSNKQIKARKKEKDTLLLKQACALILAATTLVGTITLTKTITENHIYNNNVVISIEQADTIIDNKIKSYDKLMNMYANRESQIEIFANGNYYTPNYEPLVYYDENNLAKHIFNAAKISETETRCAIIAAFKIINEPYRNNIINNALEKARKMQNNQEEIYNYRIPENSYKFLGQLGYQDWDDYNMNERKNIKETYAIEQHITKENGKGL